MQPKHSSPNTADCAKVDSKWKKQDKFTDPTGLYIIPTAYPNLMSDKEVANTPLGFGKDYIKYGGCRLYSTAHAVSAATGTYINPLTLNGDKAFFLPHSSDSSREAVFAYARSQGLVPDYWTKNIGTHIAELSNDKNTGYSIMGQVTITYPKLDGTTGSDPHWIGINGTTKDGQWAIIAPSSGKDLIKADRLGSDWKVDKNGTAYVKVSALHQIYVKEMS